MSYRKYGTLMASFGAVVLMLAADNAFARSGTAPRGAFAQMHPGFRHHHNRVPGTFFPGGGFYYGGPSGEVIADVPQPVSSDVNYTYKYDVPWDWAHRYPPAVVPSDRPYISSCSTESVTVPGRSGDRTVNVTRCY